MLSLLEIILDSTNNKSNINNKKTQKKPQAKKAVVKQSTVEYTTENTRYSKTERTHSKNEVAFKSRVSFLEKLRNKTHEDALKQAEGEFFQMSNAPFGRQKAVVYEANPNTGDVKYAGVVYTATSPSDICNRCFNF